MSSHHSNCARLVFDEMIRAACLAEFKSMRERSDDPVPKKPNKAAPRAGAAVRKAKARAARARGEEVVLTPAEVERDHLTRLQVRFSVTTNLLAIERFIGTFARTCSSIAEDQRHQRAVRQIPYTHRRSGNCLSRWCTRRCAMHPRQPLH